MDVSEQILTRLDRIIFLLEAQNTPVAVPEVKASLEVGEKPKHHGHGVSEDLFKRMAPEIVDFLVETQNVPKFILTCELLAEELNYSPSSAERVIRQLAGEGILRIDREGIISIGRGAQDWMLENPVPVEEPKPMDDYNRLRAVKVVRSLMGETTMMNGKVIADLAKEVGSERSATERLVRIMLASLPFILKPPGVGTPIRIRPTMFGAARRWLTEAERLPEGQDLEVRGISDKVYNLSAPKYVEMLLKGEKKTIDLMRATETNYHACRAILRRLNAEVGGLHVGVVGHGQPPPVRLLDADKARTWLFSRMQPLQTTTNGVGTQHP